MARKAESLGSGLTEGAGACQVLGPAHLVAGVRRLGEPEYLHRCRGQRLFHVVAQVVDEGLDLAPGGAGHHGIAHAERALLDDDGRHRAPAGLEVGFEHDAPCLSLDAGGQLFDFCHQGDLLEQVVDARALEGGHLHHDGVASPCFGHQSALGELLEHARGIGVGAVHLVDGHDDRHVGRRGVVDRLDRLGHDTVIGGHDQHDDVGGLRATGAHGREGGVARRVDERDPLVVPHHLVGPDVLGDATGLAGHHVGLADPVQEERLAVVDVAHDGHDGRPRTLVRVLFFVLFLEVARQQLGFLLLAGVDEAYVGTDFGGEELDHVVGQRLRRHDHLALQHEEADDVARAAVQLGPEIPRGRPALDDDLAVGHRRRRRLIAGELCRLELFEVAPATAGATLRRAPSGQATATGGGRPTRGSSASGTSTESSATTAGTTGETTAARATGTTGWPACAGRRSATRACGVAAPARPRGWGGRSPTAHTGWRRDRTAAGPDRGPRGRWRRYGLATRAQRRPGGPLLGRWRRRRGCRSSCRGCCRRLCCGGCRCGGCCGRRAAGPHPRRGGGRSTRAG